MAHDLHPEEKIEPVKLRLKKDVEREAQVENARLKLEGFAHVMLLNGQELWDEWDKTEGVSAVDFIQELRAVWQGTAPHMRDALKVIKREKR